VLRSAGLSHGSSFILRFSSSRILQQRKEVPRLALLHLGAALRFFSGGRPEDISVVHGISHSEVFNSVWKVLDAANVAEQLAFSYPSCRKAQCDIAAGFEARSSPGIVLVRFRLHNVLCSAQKSTQEGKQKKAKRRHIAEQKQSSNTRHSPARCQTKSRSAMFLMMRG